MPPRQATYRTVIAAIIGLLPLIPEIVKTYGLESIGWVSASLGVITIAARLLQLPAVQDYLATYFPWLGITNDKNKDNE